MSLARRSLTHFVAWRLNGSTVQARMEQARSIVREYEALVTHVFRAGDRYLDSDPVFGVRESLIADWPQQPGGSHSLEFDFVPNPAREEVLG